MRPGMRPIDSGCVLSIRDAFGMRPIDKGCVPYAPHPSLVFVFTVQNTPVSGARIRDASGMRPFDKGCILSILKNRRN